MKPSRAELQAELDDLRVRLADAELVLGAIRDGGVALTDVSGRKRTEDALRERVKELTCVASVTRDISEGVSDDELCRRAVEHLVTAMQFPAIAMAAVESKGRRFTSGNYIEGCSDTLDAELRVRGEVTGQVSVCYAEDRPFLIPEEQNLVNVVAETLSECFARRQAEEETRDLSKFPSENPNPVLRIARDGTLLYVNEACLRLMPHWLLEVGHAAPLVLRDAARQSVEDSSMRVVELEQGERVYSFHVAPIGVGYTNVYGIDITERRRTEATLARSEKKYRDLVETAHDLIWAVDAQSRITFMNQAATRIYGYAPEELIGRSYFDLLQPEERARASQSFQGLLAGGEESFVGIETDVVDRTGNPRTLLANAAILYDQDGNAGGMMGTSADITERKRAEGALRLQSTALNAASDAIIITDRAGLIHWVNPAFSALTGYTPLEAIGHNPRDLLKSGQHDRAFFQALWETILSGKTWRGEIVNRRKDGSLYTEQQSITPVRDAQGEISHFIAIKQDVTDRKRADEEMRVRAQVSALRVAIGLSLTKSDSLGRAIQQCAEAVVTHFDAALVRIWTLNDDGVLELQASAGLYTHLDGAHARIPLGQFEIGCIAKDRKPHMTNAVIGASQVHDQDWARREGIVAFAGHPLILDDRVIGVIALFARQPLPDAVMAAMASVADHIALGIERHWSSDALRTAEERMRFALEAAGVGIWDMNHTTGAVVWSEILEAQYGLPPGGFAGTFEDFSERVHPDDRASLLETIGKASKSGGDFLITHRSVWPDGTLRWLRGAGRVQLGEHGEPVRTIAISMDVTERRTLGEQYHQAQKMEAVGRLAAGVAHDFNNQLTAILGFCEFLLADFDPADQRHADLKEIQRAGTRAAELTRQLLAFSRKQIIEPTRLDLNLVVGDLRGMLERLIGEDITIVLRFQSRLPRVTADRGQVEQIVMNLAVNARDAMPHGGTLTIATATVELDEDYATTHIDVTPGKYVLLTVIDTGTGMTPEVQSHLFEPFFTTKEAGKGTGLGLATVHGIAKQNGGSIDVCSQIGVGTTFRVYLPRTEGAETADDEAPPVVPRYTGGETVLVVEDSDGLRQLARKLLTRQGYTVLVAANASEALRIFEEHPSIDLILSDVVMPGASGPELIRQLVERRPTLKVLYMSGYTDDAIVQHGVINPDIAFLNKPFTSQSLGRKIREVLDG